MGLFSNVLKRVKEGVPQAIEDRRGPGFGIGSLTKKPDLEPRSGGFLKRAVRNLKPPKFVGRPVAPPRGIKPLPIRPPSIGRPIPPISIGGIGGGRPMPINVPGGGVIDYGGGERPQLLPLQPPADNPLLRPRVDAIGNQQPIPQVRPIINNPLVPGSAEPREQTGLSAAELLELSDEELQRYIPRENIGYGVGANAKSIDTTPSPEDFRARLQSEMDLKPGERGYGMLQQQTYRPIDSSPKPTQDKRLGELLDIQGTGGDRAIPRPSIGGAGGGLPLRDIGRQPIPPQDFGFGPGIRPTEIRGPDGRIIGSAGVTPPGGTIRTMDFQDTDMNGVDDRDQPDFAGPSQEYLDQQEKMRQIFNPGTTPPAPVTPPASTTVAANQPTEAPVTDPAPVVEPSPTQTTAAPQVSGETPYAAGVTQIQSGMDPLTEQLLFGLDGQGGFIPGAMRAAEKVFYDDQGQPIVIDEQVARFSPDQLAAMQLQRQSIGMQQPYLDQAAQSYFSGLGALQSGIGESLNTAEQGVEDIAKGVGESRAMREAGLRGLVGSLDEARGLSRGATDQFGRRISGVEAGSQRAAGQFARGLGRSQFGLEQGVDQFGNRLTGVEGLQRGLTDQFGRRTAGIAGRGMSDVGRFEQGLQDPESLLRGTVGGYDQGMTEQFYNPYEDRVVQQTIEDIMEQGAKSDIGARAGDIARGGESAFGSRARLGAGERTEALGRGLAEALGGIRSSGFQRAQQAGMSEFARQKQAERSAASGLSDLASQRLGAGQNLSSMLANLSGQQLGAQQSLASGLGSLAGQRLGAGQNLAQFQRGTAGQQLASQQALQNMLRGTSAERLAAQQNLGSTLAGLGTTQQQALSQAGQQALAGQQVLGGARTGLAGMQMGAGQALQQGQFGLGSSLQGLGAQAAGASASDVASLYGMGAQQQGQAQAMLDAQRRNMQQRQMTPLLQYQALAPFISMAPAGQFQTTTQFAPKPSAMQTGIGTGLSAFGALGNLYGGS